MTRVIISTAVGLALVVAVYVSGFRTAQRVAYHSTTDTVYVDVEVPHALDKSSGSDASLAISNSVIVYDTLTHLDTLTVLIPDTQRVRMNWTPHALIDRTPLRIDTDNVTLTTFDIQRRAFVEQVYRIPTPRWGIGLETYLLYPVGAGLSAHVRYRRVTVSPYIEFQDHATYGVQVSYSLLRR